MLNLSVILKDLSKDQINQVVARGIVAGSHSRSNSNSGNSNSMSDSDSNSGSGTRTRTRSGR